MQLKIDSKLCNPERSKANKTKGNKEYQTVHLYSPFVRSSVRTFSYTQTHKHTHVYKYITQYCTNTATPHLQFLQLNSTHGQSGFVLHLGADIKQLQVKIENILPI